MSLVYLKNKKNGFTYVYECISFWNKDKKKPDSKRTCIGKLDPKTAEIIPSKRMQTIQPKIKALQKEYKDDSATL